jgi:ParB/Sulfiredoxin domain
MAWRDKYKVHPAADVFPMMSDEELAKLGEDIKANGLRSPIVVDANGAVLDGRNRLEAAERAGVILGERYHHRHTGDPVALIISLNIHRRHLTKQQQADLIVAAIKAGEKPDQVEPVSEKGGRGKVSRVKAEAVAEAKKHGISEATVKRAIAKAEGKTPKPKPKSTRTGCGAAILPEGSIYHARWYYLSLCVDPAVDLDAELDIIREAFIEIVGKRAVAASKAASTLAQDGRSEEVMDDPTPGNGVADAGDIPPELDRRKKSDALYAKLDAILKKQA